jgi:hypothetical protein
VSVDLWDKTPRFVPKLPKAEMVEGWAWFCHTLSWPGSKAECRTNTCAEVMSLAFGMIGIEVSGDDGYWGDFF